MNDGFYIGLLELGRGGFPWAMELEGNCTQPLRLGIYSHWCCWVGDRGPGGKFHGCSPPIGVTPFAGSRWDGNGLFVG